MPSYRVSFADRARHHVDVELRVDSVSGPIDLWMPTWTPGSYLIREFARHVRNVSASSAAGRSVPIERLDKASFRLFANAGESVTVRYRLYCNDPTVRTNFVDEHWALLNGAASFFAVRGAEKSEHSIELGLPGDWRCVSGLREGGGPDRRVASDYDELVDGPIACGELSVADFEACGLRHVFAIAGTGNHDVVQLAADTKKIVETAAGAFGALSYADYTFFLFTTKDAQGGLEHRNSTVLAFPRFGFRDDKTRIDLASLVAHEHFHSWNVKRTKPRDFVPYDLSNETYTRGLWICEGVTSYYDEHLVLRAGVMTRDQYLARLGDDLNRYLESPGRLEQDLEESSLTTWTRFYRQDEDYPNSGISYYLKGGLVALLLDLEIRTATGMEKSLDDVMRTLFARHPFDSQGYTIGEFEALCSEVAGRDLTAFFDRAVRSTAELEFAEPLSRFGIDYVLAPRTPEPSVRDWIGVRIKAGANPLRVDVVERGSAADRAGILAHDEIIAIGGMRATVATLAQRLSEHRGSSVRVAVFREDALRDRELTVPQDPSRIVKLEARKDVSAEVARRRDAWLGTNVSPPKAT